MKYCSHCGEQLEDDAEFCSKCGQRCEDKVETVNAEFTNNDFNPNNFGPNQGQYNNYQNGQYNNDPDANKSIRGTGLGVVFGLFLGLIGLIIVLLAGDKKAKKACLITFGINIGINILTIILAVILGASAAIVLL